MDTPKRKVSWLESFPPDIWAHFAWYIPGEQLGRLTLTGATLLRQRLKYPLVVKSATLGQDFMIFKSFPRFLNDFPSLEELLIHSRGDEINHRPGMMIDCIPSGVRKLELRGPWWNESATKLFGDGGTLKLSQHLPHLETLSLNNFDFGDYSWLAHSPQSLTKLSIRDWDGTVELPPSLSHFEAWNVTISATTFVSKLPLSLESFVVKSSLRGGNLVVPILSSSSLLACLSCVEISDSGLSLPSFLEQLPRALTSFTVPRCDATVSFEANPDLSLLLPSTLTELSISPDFPSSAWNLLPQHLTTLVLRTTKCTRTVSTLNEDGSPLEFQSIPFETLPRSITSLKLLGPGDFHFCGPPEKSNRSYFPPKLTLLDVHYNIQLSPEAAKLLPPSLTHLKIRNLCGRVCEHLPRGLKTLIASGTLMSPNLIELLPKSLTFLHLTHQMCTPCFDYSTGKVIDLISNHPEYAIHEECMSKGFNWKDHCPLPSSLTYFQLIGNKLGDSFLAHQQLPNLLELNLEQSKHFTDLSIPLLPLHLTALNLRSSGKISGKAFPFLPRFLTDLDLRSSKSIFDWEIQNLPRTLKYAYLSDAKHLTDLCIPKLPPHLQKLNLINNKKITLSSFPCLPYPCRSSQSYRSAEFANWYVQRGVTVQK